VINYNNIKYEQYDYIIYQYYLVIFHKFEIINTTPITKLNWSFERLCTTDTNILNNLLDIKYGFSWNNKEMYNLNKNFIESHGGFLVYHLDS
jgi:hypothetical protein